ncbi:13144_t:CDS:2 [Gigaspora margarita]|uniref:13144_t:CDS:1 n=1 Tax=Gigaspora margarita TaxID=4874 RepID=A0ABN7UI14_GIGMA|nr:13144_t:CDS:2 [Gigaspora margarita]
MSNIQSNDSLSAKLLAEICELRKKIEELEKNSADISAENAELKAELAKLRHDFDSFNLTRLQQPQHVTNAQNSCSGEKISEVTAVPQPDTEPERRFASHDIPDPVMSQPINGASSNNADIKSFEDKKTDSFLDEVHKKKVSNEIRQRNREKKLLCESSTKDLSRDVWSLCDPQRNPPLP